MSKNGSNNRVRNHVARLYEEQDGKCYYCGTPDMYIRGNVTKKYHRYNRHFMATFDHIVPKSEGGTYKFENGVCACLYCNSTRGNITVEAFIEKLDVQLKHKTIRIRDPETANTVKYPSPKQLKIQINRAAKWRMNCFMIGRFAEQIGWTADDLFLEFVYNNTYKLIEARYG